MVATTETSQLLETRPGGSEYVIGHVDFPGTAGNLLSTPDASALDITGDICFVCRIAPDDWSPSAINEIVGKWRTLSSVSYLFRLLTTGALQLAWSADGSAALTATSTDNLASMAAGSWVWIAATLDVDNGSGGRSTRFWYSTQDVALSDVTWTQLGSTVTVAATTSIFAGTSQVEIGASVSTATTFSGLVQHVSIRSGIGAVGVVGGTEVFLFDGEDDLLGESANATSFTASTGQTITVNRSGATRTTLTPTGFYYTEDVETSSVLVGSGDWRLHVERLSGNADGAEWDLNVWDSDAGTPGFVTLPGVAGNYLSIPDTSDFDIVGDLAIVARVAADDWTPGGPMVIAGKWGAAGQRSYRLVLRATGELRLIWSEDGTASLFEDSTVATGVTDGAWKWVAATLDVDNGLAGRNVRFWTSDTGNSDTPAWTQLGSTVTTAGVTSIFASTAALEIGSSEAGTVDLFDGKIDNVQIFAHQGGVFTGPRPVDMPGGQLRFQLYDADFTTSPFTTASGHTATLNTSGGTPAAITAAADVEITEWAEFGWEPMIDFLRGMEWTRGAEQPYGRPRIGEIQVTLGADPASADLFAAACDPWVDYQNTRPGTVMRAALTSETDVRSDGWLPLWVGVVESWTPAYFGARESGYRADNEVTVQLVETLSWVALIDDNATTLAGSGDTVVDRVDRLLTAAEWPFGLTTLFGPAGEPTIALQSTDMSANRLTELYLAADSTTAVVMSAPGGKCRVTDRSGLKESRLAEFSTGDFGFGDQPLVIFTWQDASPPDAAWFVRYTADSVVTVNDPEPIINDHRYARVGGTQQTAEHAASIGVFGRRTRARNDLMCSSNADVLTVAQDDNDREARTALRIDAIEIVATGRPHALLVVAAADWSDSVWVFPPAVDGFTGSAIGVIRSLTHQVTPLHSGGVHWAANYAIDLNNFVNMPGAILPVAS